MRDSDHRSRRLASFWRPLLFFLILCILMEGMSFIVVRSAYLTGGDSGGRNAVYFQIENEKPQTIQIVNVGDSLSYTAFSPMQVWRDYGLTSIDCGQPGQRTEAACSVLQAVFKSQKPAVVLMEAHCLFVSDQGAKELENQFGELLGRVFPIVRYHSFWNKDTWGEGRRGAYQGFRIRASINPYTKGDYMSRRMKRTAIPDANRESLAELRELCDENGAQLVLYSSPSPRNYNRTRVKVLLKMAKELDIPCIDLNSKVSAIGIDWQTDSLDGGDHLNIFGAQKTTAFLMKYLRKNLKIRFTDTAEKVSTSEWNEMADEYQKIVKKALKRIRQGDMQTA